MYSANIVTCFTGFAIDCVRMMEWTHDKLFDSSTELDRYYSNV